MTPGTAEVLPEVEALGLDFEGLEGRLERAEEGAGGLGGDFVLNDDVGLEALAVLWGEVFGEGCGQLVVEGQEGGRGEGVGDAFAEGAKAGDGQGEGFGQGCGGG